MIMTIGLLVWGCKQKLFMGVIVREVMFHVLNRMERWRETTKSCTVFKVGTLDHHHQMKEFTLIVSLGCITRFRSILHLIP